jgi:hypothetical protein
MKRTLDSAVLWTFYLAFKAAVFLLKRLRPSYAATR